MKKNVSWKNQIRNSIIMKKIIFTGLLVSSTILFAKTEVPKLEKGLPKEEKVLVAKKNIKNEKVEKAINIKVASRTLLEQCLIDVKIIDAISPTPGAGAFYFATRCIPLML